MSRPCLVIAGVAVATGSLWWSQVNREVPAPQPLPPVEAATRQTAEPQRAGVTFPPLDELGLLDLVDALRAESSPEKRSSLKNALASITDQSLAPSMLSYLVASADEDICQALQQSLGRVATPELTMKLADAYQTAPGDMAAYRIAQAVGNIQSVECLPALAAIINAPGAPLEDALNHAALAAISRIGTSHSVTVLTQRTASASSNDLAALTLALSRVRTGGTEHELMLVAEGKRPNSTSTAARVGAIRALGNYPLSLTRETLTDLAGDADERIAKEALALLR